MAGLTLAMAEAKLTEYLDAETKILASQSVSMNGRALTLADLGAVQAGIDTWNRRVQRLDRGGIKSYNARPLG